MTRLILAILWLVQFLHTLAFQLEFDPVTPLHPIDITRIQSTTYPWRIVECHASSLWAVWTHTFRRWFHLVDDASIWQVTPHGQLMVYLAAGYLQYYELHVQHGQWVRLANFAFPPVQQLSTCTEGNQWLVLTEAGRYYMLNRGACKSQNVRQLFSKQALILDSVRIAPPYPDLLPFGISYFRNLLAMVHTDPLQTLLYESEVNLFTVYRLRLTDVMSQPHQLLHIHDHMDASFLWVLDRDENQPVCHAWMLPIHPESQPLYSLPGDRFVICFPWILALNTQIRSWALYRHEDRVQKDQDVDIGLKPCRTGVLPLWSSEKPASSIIVDVDSQGHLWWFFHNTWFV